MSKTNTIESIFLSDSDLEILTGRSRHRQQMKVLTSLGISYAINANGAVVVTKDHVKSLLASVGNTTKPLPSEPDFSSYDNG